MEPSHFRRAFTLIELLVVLGIIATVTTIALSSESNFNKTFILANTAYDVALTFRFAQSFGVGGRALPSASNAGYGLHFQSGANDFFVLFADTSPSAGESCTRPDCKPGDRLFSNTDALVQTYTLGNDITISDFCTFSDRPRCASTGEVQSLDITFARPNSDAFIRANDSPYTEYTEACLAISAPQGTSRFVSVTSSGEILANASSCP